MTPPIAMDIPNLIGTFYVIGLAGVSVLTQLRRRRAASPLHQIDAKLPTAS
jgi:hypothetical protein